jgi:GT2 family glycosyltransferase
VLISVDHSSDDTAGVCRRFLGDSRFSLVEQDSRLGWVDNCNWLLSRVETPYSFILPHDDLIEQGYLERLLEVAKSHPQAAVVYCDIESFGHRQHHRIVQQSIRGAWFTRVRTYLLEHDNAVAWRGLMRLDALKAAGSMAHNDAEDFAADTAWLFKLVKQGEFIRIPESLYKKRFWHGSEYKRWLDHHSEDRMSVWREHCLELAREAFGLELSPGEKTRIIEALIIRLRRAEMRLEPVDRGCEPSRKGRREMLEGFLSDLGELEPANC